MEVMQTFPNGTVIEFGDDLHGNQVHRVSHPAATTYRYVEPYVCALAYAQQYEEYFAATPNNLH
jgi:hypothetical protein